MSYVCHICGKSFANASNRHRHIKGVHLNIVDEAKTHLNKEQSLALGSTVRQHPFTCIVAGCTQSGKTDLTLWIAYTFSHITSDLHIFSRRNL